MGRDCEIKLPNGENCGIPAIGYCIVCEKAFCRTHQAQDTFGVQISTNHCGTCLTRMSIEGEEKREKFLTRMGEAHSYIVSGAARADLLASEVQPVTVYWSSTTQKWGLFGRREVKTVINGRGWILGKFEWAWSKYVRSGGGFGQNDVYDAFGENMLTVLLDEDPCAWQQTDEPISGELAAVRHTSEGYEIACRGMGKSAFIKPDQLPNVDMTYWRMEVYVYIVMEAWVWFRLEQAVRQLVDSSRSSGHRTS